MKKIYLLLLPLVFIISSCGGGGGSSPAPAPVPLPSVTFTSSLSTVETNAEFTLTWSSNNASSCTASGSESWTGSKDLSGSETISEASVGTITYKLTCTNATGSSSKEVSVEITAPVIYTKIDNELSNVTWDAFSTAVLFRLEEGSIDLLGEDDDGFLDEIGFGGYDNFTIDTNVADSETDGFVLSYSGSTDNSSTFNTISLDISIGTDIEPVENNVFEYGETQSTFIVGAVEFDAFNMNYIRLNDDYLQSLAIEYSEAFLLAVDDEVNDLSYLVPTVYGDATEITDMPSGNTTSEFNGMSLFYEENPTIPYDAFVAVTGQGSIDFNHTDNTLSGSYTLDNWMDFETFIEGNAADVVFESPSNKGTVVLTFVDGIINGNNFTADILFDDTAANGVYFTGKLVGGFYGPNGDEISGSLFLRDGDSDENYYGFSSGIIFGK